MPNVKITRWEIEAYDATGECIARVGLRSASPGDPDLHCGRLTAPLVVPEGGYLKVVTEQDDPLGLDNL